MHFIIREACYEDAPALADVVIESTVDTFQNLVPDRCLTWLTKEESITNWQRWFAETGKKKDQFLYVAQTIYGPVVGCVLAGPLHNNRVFQGELFLLGVLPAYQGQGIGKQLVKSAAKRLANSGILTLQVKVLKINPNRGFYEHLGARYLSEHPHNWNGVIFAEAIYGWPDTTLLIHDKNNQSNPPGTP